MFIMPSFKKSLIVEQFQGNYLTTGNLTKYDAFRMNRDQAMDFEIWFKIHTNVFNFDTASPKII